MNSRINLLARNTDEIEKKLKRLRFVRIVAVAFLVFVATASIISFILNSQIQIAQIKKDQQIALESISSLSAKAGKLYLAKDRVKNISTILSKRKNYIQIFSPLLQNLPEGLSVDAFSIDQQVMLLTVSGASLTSVNSFLDLFVGVGNNNKSLQNLTIQSLSINFEGKYILVVRALVL